MDNNQELLEKYNQLKEDYDRLLEEKRELERRLKKYTAPERAHRYYEKHKEDVKEKVKEYQSINKDKPKKKKVLCDDKIKEYNRRAYLKRKEKLKNKEIQ